MEIYEFASFVICYNYKKTGVKNMKRLFFSIFIIIIMNLVFLKPLLAAKQVILNLINCRMETPCPRVDTLRYTLFQNNPKEKGGLKSESTTLPATSLKKNMFIFSMPDDWGFIEIYSKPLTGSTTCAASDQDQNLILKNADQRAEGQTNVYTNRDPVIIKIGPELSNGVELECRDY